MKLKEFVNYLDDMYSLDSFHENDISISKRFSIFPESVYASFEEDFVKRSNGLVFNNGEEVYNIVFACFLSDSLWKSFKELDLWDTVIITHHIYDIDTGEPGSYSGKGFSTISIDFFEWLKERRISVYALHLPLDNNNQIINNHNAFCDYLGIKPEAHLLDFERKYTMGYISIIKNSEYLRISNLFKQVVTYGTSLLEKKQYKVAILAGMISSVDMLEKIANYDVDIFVCGDVLLRDGSDRMKKIETYLLEECPFHIICVSHQCSEEIGLAKLMHFMEQQIEDINYLFINGEDRWK